MTDLAGRPTAGLDDGTSRRDSAAGPQLAASARRSGHDNRRVADKLRPPVYAFAPVRTHLFDQLVGDGARRKITTIVAPPGYGKTVLLSELYRQFCEQGIACSWIGLDDRDRASSNFLTLLENALALTSSEPARLEALPSTDDVDRVETILQLFTQSERPHVIIVDNIDFCQDPHIDRTLNALVFRSPSNIRFIISSASGPVPFDAGRARLEMNLRAITTSDLSFDRTATSALFATAGIPNVDDRIVDTIVARTEGWPAAIRMMQLISETRDSLEQGLKLLTGKETHLSDMLSRRLIKSFDPELVTFLYEIAELRHFSAELALAATGNPRAHFWVRYLVDRNIMIVPIGDRQSWFRFHTLFREFLISEANRLLPPDRRRTVHAKAAMWLSQRGDDQNALELAISAGERPLVTELLERTARSLMHDQGDTSAFISWIERADAIGADRGVQASFWYIWALIFERRYQKARAEIAGLKAARLDHDQGPLHREMCAKLALAEIIIAVHLDTLEEVRIAAPRWLREFPDGDLFDTAAASGTYALPLLCNHEYAETRRILRVSHAAVARSDSEYGRCWVEALSGMTDIGQGEPAAAAHRLKDVVDRARASIGPAARIASIVGLVRARALYDCGHFDEAKQIVAEQLERAATNGVPDTTWLGIEVAIPFALKDAPPFTIAALRAIARENPRRLQVLFETALVRHLILADQKNEALKLAGKLGWDPKCGWSDFFSDAPTKMEQSAVRLAAIALLNAAGHHARATELIQEEMSLAQATGRQKAVVDLYLFSAEINLKSGSTQGTARAISRAIAVAARNRLYSPFLERKSILAQALKDIRARDLALTGRDDIEMFATVTKFASPSKTHATLHASDVATEMPTPRELELLGLLEVGLDNEQLADRLSVSVRTIKWHLSNLYAKLGVKNRSSAVAKGRALRLLS